MSLDNMVKYKIDVIIDEYKKYKDNLDEEEVEEVTMELFAVASQAIERAFWDEVYINKVVEKTLERLPKGD